ncbi:MAG TPA: alpha/beta hydrolase [Streptosporangiaceae bacterium]
MDEQQITLEGSQQIVYSQTEGTGRAVIFVHGNSSSSRTWLPVMTAPFGQRYRCLAFDLPGHGSSAPAGNPEDYSLPGYATVLAAFAQATGAADAVVVGWSLGGHIALEAAPAMPAAAGYVVFGTPPVASAAQMSEAFLPNPVMNVGFTAAVSADEARAYAASFTKVRSALPLDGFVADILRTDGEARSGLLASIGQRRFADELAIVGALRQPLAILQGEGEQLVSLDYLNKLTVPTLWRGAVQVIPGAGHALHQETPVAFTARLEQFIADLP